MSGGGKEKKVRSKAQGWEEAGAEFYQESYPGDVENNVHRDPSKLATLLPSKQTRVGKLIGCGVHRRHDGMLSHFPPSIHQIQFFKNKLIRIN